MDINEKEGEGPASNKSDTNVTLQPATIMRDMFLLVIIFLKKND